MRGGGQFRIPGRMPPTRVPSSTNWLVLGSVALAGLVALAAVAGGAVYFLTRPGPAPRLIIQQPVGSLRTEVGQPVLIQGQATDLTGVTRIELWVNGALNTTIPGTQPGGRRLVLVDHTWTPGTGGVHNLSLVAYNTQGQASEDHSVVVTVADSETETEHTPDPVSTPEPTSSGASGAGSSDQTCTNDSRFAADVTVADHTTFGPGDRFDKTWQLRNSGSCSWGPDYRLAFYSGEQMGAPAYQAVAATSPGATADVTIGMYAPANPGTHKGVWRMTAPDGTLFGQSVTVLIQVVPSAGSEQAGSQAGSGPRSDVAWVKLSVISAQGAAWSDPTGSTLTAIQWQDGHGGWNTVDTWIAPLTAPQVVWEVFRKDYSSGPFRWVVYDSGKILGESTPFHLPGADGESVDVVVTLSDLPID